MKHLLVAATLVSAVCVLPGRAAAVTVLASAPLPRGAGGVECACTNLTKEAIVVDIRLSRGVSSVVCADLIIGSGLNRTCTTTNLDTRNCRVSRDDGKNASTQRLACTLSALDADGNPTATVPVDMKLKQ